jgi:hypothetical protein
MADFPEPVTNAVVAAAETAVACDVRIGDRAIT